MGLHGCGASAAGPAPEVPKTPALPEVMLVTETDEPGLFLGPSTADPAIGYISGDVEVRVEAPLRAERVQVRIDGPLKVKAFMPARLLNLKVQRRGRLRGTPVYLSPGDRVQFMEGAAHDPQAPARQPRLTLTASPRVTGRTLGTFEGSFPADGVSVTSPASDAPVRPAGQLRQLPARTEIVLHASPDGEVVVRIPAQDTPMPVRVVHKQGEWQWVLVGDGPALVGYTRAALQRGPAGPAPGESTNVDASTKETAQPMNVDPGKSLPERLAEGRTTGELRRVLAGAQVRFNETVVAVFKADGWARVQAVYPGGQVDVYAAADNRLAVRGLVDERFLRPATTP